MQIIKPGSNWDFMSRRKTFFTGSLIVMGLCLASLVVQGLNLGIDFKGGTKLIAAFEAGSDVDRGEIEAAIDGMVEAKTGRSGTQIEVQDFDVGASAEEGLTRFVVYTEITSLVSSEERDKLTTALSQALGEAVRIETRAQGEDKFYLTFPDKASVSQRTELIRSTFAANGFEDLSIQSEAERLLDLEYYKTINLAELDSQQAEDGAPSPFEKSQAEYDAEKTAKLAALSDDRFTVKIEALTKEFESSLTTAFGQKFIEVESSTSVSASVGRDMLNNGLIAILYALIGILLYIALRFDFRYSPGAVLALAHDSLITVGLFSILQVKFTQPIIAAVLTIIGYSLNDTIVVYDRIRENVDRFRNKRLEDTVNISINETLSRTVLTSLTTLVVVVSILLLAGGLIRDFAFALLIGVLVGTYSSIFIASPLVVYLDQYFKRRGDVEAKPAAGAPAASKT